MLASGSQAHAATGDLTFLESRADAGLTGARGVTVSPDGRNVYVAGQNADSLVMYSRGADGALTSLGCIKDSGAPGSCATSAEGLYSGASPSPRATARTSTSRAETTARLASSAATSIGVLTPIGCSKDTTGSATARTAPPASSGRRASHCRPTGRTSTSRARTDHDRHVHARQQLGGAVGAVVPQAHAPRPRRARPTPTRCSRLASSRSRPTARASTSPPPTNNVITALRAAGRSPTRRQRRDVSLPVDVAVSPDNAHVYAGAVTSRAVRAYARDPATSASTQADCASDAGAALVLPGQRRGPRGRRGRRRRARRRDRLRGRATDDAVVALTRNGLSGSLGALGCLRDTPGRGRCDTAGGLNGAHGVAVSPDGRNVYVTGFDGASLSVLAREAPVQPAGGPRAGGADPRARGARRTRHRSTRPGRRRRSRYAWAAAWSDRGRGARVQVRTDGTSSWTLFETEGNSLTRAENTPPFRRHDAADPPRGHLHVPIQLTSRGEERFRSRSRPPSVGASLACDPVRYPSFDPRLRHRDAGTGHRVAEPRQAEGGHDRPDRSRRIRAESRPGRSSAALAGDGVRGRRGERHLRRGRRPARWRTSRRAGELRRAMAPAERSPAPGGLHGLQPRRITIDRDGQADLTGGCRSKATRSASVSFTSTSTS